LGWCYVATSWRFQKWLKAISIISPRAPPWVYNQQPNGVFMAEGHIYHQPMGIALGL
jgi:hypothetical protein